MATDDLTRGQENHNRELGFGSVVVGKPRQRLLNQDGSFNTTREGRHPHNSTRLYRYLLTISWAHFLLLVVFFYLAVNALFALCFLACGPGAVSNTTSAQPLDRFLDAFFFSVQTLATIGYGDMSPQTRPAHILVTIESLSGLLSFALVAGLLFARFSRPTGRIVFSRIAVIAPYRDITALEFRLIAYVEVVEVETKILLSRLRPDGIREFLPLKLERDRVIFLPLVWTVVHPIDPSSPLYGQTPDELIASEAEILVLVTAYDEAFGQIFHSRTSYLAGELIWNARFANLFVPPGPAGLISIDIDRFNEVQR